MPSEDTIVRMMRQARAHLPIDAKIEMLRVEFGVTERTVTLHWRTE